MLNLQKVENETKLFRDTTSKAIINTDEIGYQKYLKTRQRLLQTQDVVEKNSIEIKELKHELTDIKEMLAIIIANIQK